MSVATEFAPEVYLPASARRAGTPSRSVRRSAASRLTLVSYAGSSAKPQTLTPALRRSFVMPPAAPVGTDAVTGLLEPVRKTPAAPARQPRTVQAPAGRTSAPTPTALRYCTPAAVAREVQRQAVAPLRLTRRGVTALVVGAVVFGALLLLVAHLSLGSPSHGSAAGAIATTVTVQPGDTLWSIAHQVAPDRDPRRVVDQLRKVNALSGVALTPGQTLKLN
jgi:nucleoid-associated protein YgaU